MERKITLQKNYSLADVTIGWISPYLNGKSLAVLLWINIGIKFRKKTSSDFKIKWSYIASQLNTRKSNVTREVRNLIKKGILQKQDSGVYVWNKEGIELLINNIEEKVQKAPQPIVTPTDPVMTKPMFFPARKQVDEYGLVLDLEGNIVY